MHFVIDTHGAPASTQPGNDGANAIPPQFEQRFRRVLKARYDAAGLSPEMEAWWAQADSMSPRAAANKSTRQRIRQRARYEFIESGCIAVGMIKALTNAVVGCGPTLQVKTPDKRLNRLIEDEWHAFAKAIRLRQKLRTMFTAKVVDGEAFGEQVNDPTLPTPVKWNLRLSEADLWTNPQFNPQTNDREDDGIIHDDNGNPILYLRLKRHPGDDSWTSVDPWKTEPIAAPYVIHWFEASRPGQRRGMSEVAPSLRPLAELRRYKMSVQAAMETAANHAGIMFSTASAFSESPAEIDEGDLFGNIGMPRNSLLTLPEGWDMKQLKAEQPTTHYVEFVEERIAAAARPIQQPLNIAMGSSRNHNFASSRLDYLQYAMSNEPRRKDCDDIVLDRLFHWWLAEARVIDDYLPPVPKSLPIEWQWPRSEPVDIVAQAKADEAYWNMGLLTDEQFCKRESLDVDEMAEQWTRQTERRSAAGDSFPQPGIARSESIQEEPEPVGTSDE